MPPFRWVASFILIGLAIAATFLAVAYLFPGESFIERLGAAYRVLWENTTQRQFTFIMRDNPLASPRPSLISISSMLSPSSV